MPSIDTAQSELPPEVLEQSIQGQNLGGATRLRELLGSAPAAKPVLVAFLRHFG